MTTTFDQHRDDTHYAHLQQVARAGLRAFNLQDAKAVLTLLNAVNNAVYRVEYGADIYVLRLSRDTDVPQAWRTSEGDWLRILANAGLRVPEPVGVFYAPDVDTSGYGASLFRWLDGEALSVAGYTPQKLHALGAITAQMHDTAARTVLPDGFARPRLDWGGLFGKHAADGTPSQYASTHEDTLFSAAQKGILHEVGARVRVTLDALGADRDNTGLIHADLIAKNILFDADGRIGVIDFDESAFGTFLYDLTPSLWLTREEAGYLDHRAALWAGYTSIRPQPESYLSHLEALVAARHAASCRWLARNAENPALRGRVRDVLDYRFRQMRDFLETGSLHR